MIGKEISRLIEARVFRPFLKRGLVWRAVIQKELHADSGRCARYRQEGPSVDYRIARESCRSE